MTKKNKPLETPIPTRFSERDIKAMDQKRRAFSRSAFIRLAVKLTLSQPDVYEQLRKLHEEESTTSNLATC